MIKFNCFALGLFCLMTSATSMADSQIVCTRDMATLGSPNYTKKCHDDFYKQQWLDNQRQQLELQKQQLEHQKRMDEYNLQMQKEQTRQQKIAQLQKQCAQEPSAQPSAVCNAINNHIKYGLPLSDEQLGLQ
jgi:hypothetical protein